MFSFRAISRRFVAKETEAFLLLPFAFWLLAFLPGCSSDLAVPAEAQVACQSAADCPSGWTCNEKVGRCVKTENIDSTAPALDGDVTVAPAVLKKGAKATVTLSVSEELSTPPVVTVSAGTDRLLTPASASAPPSGASLQPPAYVFEYTAAGDEPQGVESPISIVLTDKSGNESGKLSGGLLKFDFKAPDVLDPELSGSPARTGGTATVTFNVSEEIKVDPVVKLSTGETMVKDPASTGLKYVFSHTAAGTESQEPAGVGITIELADEAGNAASVVPEDKIVFDFNPPGLVGGIEATPESVKIGSPLSVVFESTEALREDPVVKVGEIALSKLGQEGNRHVFTHIVELADGESPKGVTVSVVDRAGNPSGEVAGPTVGFDFVPAEIQNVGTASKKHSAKAGFSIVALTFDSSEDVGTGLSATLGGAGMSCGAWQAASPNYACTYTVTGNEGEGVKEVSIAAVDGAGNVGFGSTSVELDFAGPTLQLSVQPNNRPARLGELVTVGVASGEALDANGIAMDSGALSLGTPTGSGTSYSWTYTVKDGDNGVFSLSATATDVVGNPAAAPATGTLSLDGVAPTVSNTVLNPPRVAKGGQFTLTFDVSEPPGADPEVAFNNGVDAPVQMKKTSNTGLTYTYTGTAPDAGSAQFYGVTVSVADAAGNRAVASAGMVEIDNVAPTLAGLEVAPSAAKLSTVLRAVLTATETLAGPPALSAKSGQDTIIFSPADSTPGKISYVYSYSVTGATPQGTFTVDPFDLTDEAANTRAAVAPDPAVSFVVDSLAPSLSSSTISPGAVKHGDTITIDFTASEDLSGTPIVRIGALELGTCAADPNDARHWTCTHAAESTEGDGVKQVYVELTDAAGNPATLSPGTVTYDVSAPRITGGSLQREPYLASAVDRTNNTWYFSPTDPLTGQAVKAGLLVFANEALGAKPSLVVTGPGGATLGFVEGGSSGSTAGFGYIFNGTEIEGEYTFAVTWEDALGNKATVPFAGLKMVVDRTPPDSAQLDFAKILYKRVPWGSDATGGVARFSLVGDPGAVKDVSDIESVLVYRSQTPSAGTLIGSATVSKTAPDTGSFSVPELMGGDLPKIYVSVTDRAGVQSVPQLVTEIEWTATMGYKIPGSTFENPNVFTSTGIFAGWLTQNPEFNFEPSAADLAKGAQVDTNTILRTAEATWLELNKGTTPGGRTGHALVYDAARGKLVLFGGNDGSNRQDTWEWDGAAGTWTERTPSGPKPSARYDHAMEYDSARGRVVMFGGYDGNVKQDIWEWDGATGTWTDRTPAGTKPTARQSPAIAYDSARGRVVVFGGTGLGNWQDTWEWDGTTGTWTERTLSGEKPSARQYHAMTYDRGRGRVLLFGGSYMQDTWEWDGVSGIWTERVISGAKPSVRQGHTVAYDSARGRVVLFGGSYLDGAERFLQDTWEWDGTAGIWTDRTPGGAKPSARDSHAMSFDVVRGKVVLFSGREESVKQDAWEWDGEMGSWTERTLGSDRPSARTGPQMVYDSVRGRIFLFGGTDSSYLYKQDSWEWDGAGGIWTDRTPIGAKPSARQGFAITYDSVRGRVVLFGGYDGSYRQDIWEWDGAAGTWTERTAAGTKPSSRCGGLAYDSARQRVVLFGGYDGSSRKQDTWEWDGAAGTWTERTLSGTKPSARSSHAMTYDSTRGKVVMFGGSPEGSTVNDTWEWDGNLGTWTDRTQSGTKPSVRISHTMVFDGVRSRVVLFGGYDGSYISGTWEWDGATGEWTDRTLMEPGARRDHAMAYDASRGKVVLFGGSDGSLKQDTWEWDGGAFGRPAQIMNTSFGSAGLSATPDRKSVASAFYSGGVGYPSGVATNGVDLKVWDEGMWKTIATNNSPPNDPQLVTWTTTDPQVISRLFFGDQQTLNFAVTPVAPNGTGTGEVSVDYVEVTVKYKMP